MLDPQLNDILKQAMLAKDEAKVRTLRAVKSAFLLAKTEKGSTGEITEEQEIKLLQKLLNQRRESYDIFSREGRAELAQKEKEEMDILASFLPKSMSNEELQKIIGEVIAQTGATDMKDMGKVIGMVNQQVKGRAEGKIIAEFVRKALA